MYKLHYSNKGKKDIRRLKKNPNFEMEELEYIFDVLAQNKILDKKYRNHKLHGDCAGCYECHIRPNVLLVYEIDDVNNIVFINRIGSHSELFG